ncbi:NADH dehydrogenase-like protein [Anoxybacillus thermarum]|uniref:NADH dehydrogenase-like protein n=1 Tax=Anoxybacillus thermarum TaxID=404937 RepID=A0A0D0RZ71_9BACL|nr:FAD-dependent oxidoreductase [Anoxybacillus thermarum]KIQ93936.1 NADH dehydrogenase-like protein [Anoxybacillus thermarum]
MANIIVVGGNFAGLTAALELKRKLGSGHQVTVISKSPVFVFIPSLIWVPFSEREIKDITLPVEPILSKANVKFIHAEALKVDPEKQKVETTKGTYSYDYLVMATGPDLAFDEVEGLGENSNVSCICHPKGAMETRKRWEEFVKNPGPVVIGAAPIAGCSGAAYEFLFNFEQQCRAAGIRDQVDITWVTPEPFLGHFGIEGIAGGEAMLKVFMKMLNIRYITNAAIKKVTGDEVILDDGRHLPYKFSMIMPAFYGAKVVRNSPGLGNQRGFIPVHDTYQHKVYPTIFAVGIAADYPVSFHTKVPLGMPKTGYPADESAKTAAENIVRLIRGEKVLKEKPMGKIPGLCIMDAGKKEVLIVTNSLLKPRKFAMLLPNPLYDIGKRLFEKYFMWKTKNGLSYLP